METGSAFIANSPPPDGFSIDPFSFHHYARNGRSPAMRPWSIKLAVLAVVAVGMSWSIVEYRRWRRFVVVKPGVLYRSNLLANNDLAEMLSRNGIKTVFSL